MKQTALPATKLRKARRTARKPDVKWRDTSEHSADDSVTVDDRGQAQPKNYRTAQRTSRTRP